MSERKELIKLLSIETPNLEKAAMLADYLLSHGVKIPVRCSECKYYIPNGSFCVKTASWAYDSSAFCSYGERKDNG